MILFYGRKTRFLKSIPIQGASCAHCGSQTMTMDFYGSYLHFFLIPVAPTGMKAFRACEHCNKTIRQQQFDQHLKLLRAELRKQVSYPKWYFSGSLILVAFVLFCMVMVTLQNLGIFD